MDSKVSDGESTVAPTWEIVIVGAGAAGIATAASLLARRPDLRIALVDPAEVHYYQPGFTLVGAGVFTPGQTSRAMDSVIPRKATWIKAAVQGFAPERNRVILDSGEELAYERLVVCPGLELAWDAVEGLPETLGKNGVTSNYHPRYGAYTWELVRGLEAGKAIFTQPPMPIKCAGAPQKALYLSSDFWLGKGVLDRIEVQFRNAGAVLFGVKEYVPALQSYVDKYHARLLFSHNLVKVDGPARKAWFEVKDAEGAVRLEETAFDMLHVCPPQRAPAFIRSSPLADAAGWVDVDHFSLRHRKYPNIWSLGDAGGMPNAKTAAAVRKQAPVVAANIVADIDHAAADFRYNGYGSCPLTVERGKVVLAEFAYGGKLDPSFPRWLLDGTRPSRLAWWIKETALPRLYWDVMLKGRELLVHPEKAPAPHDQA